MGSLEDALSSMARGRAAFVIWRAGVAGFCTAIFIAGAGRKAGTGGIARACAPCGAKAKAFSASGGKTGAGGEARPAGLKDIAAV